MRKLGYALSTAAALCALVAPAAAQDYNPIEGWEATTVQMDIGKMTIVRIGVEEWTTADDRKTMLEAFASGGADAVVDFLKDQSEKGYVKFPSTAAYQMRYAFQAEHEGKRYVVMATDRPVGNLWRRDPADTWGNNISLLSLVLDLETGKGEGTLIAGAEITLDEKTHRLKIGHVGTQPVRFTSVKQMKIKKKKK